MRKAGRLIGRPSAFSPPPHSQMILQLFQMGLEYSVRRDGRDDGELWGDTLQRQRTRPDARAFPLGSLEVTALDAIRVMRLEHTGCEYRSELEC